MPFHAPQPLNSGFGLGNLMGQNLMSEALQLKSHFENSPNDLQFILHQNPELAQAVLSDDINVLMNYLGKKVVSFRIIHAYKGSETKGNGSQAQRNARNSKSLAKARV